MTTIRESTGIRYATLSGGKRFDLPQAATGRLKDVALASVPVFPQLPSRLSAVMGHGGERNPQDDDAFFLNLWASEGAEALPVMVFVHGGAWTTGGGSLPWYSGHLLAGHGAVVVTVNYRLGSVGHLYSGPEGQDLPLEDLLLALNWVQENIADFGGDPHRVTLAGQSAGGWYAHALSMSERAKGLFHRVALLSMGTRRPWTRQKQEQVQQTVKELLGGTDPAEAEISELLHAGAAAVAPSQRPLGRAPSSWLPVESSFLPPGFLEPASAVEKLHVAEVYLRNTRDETGTFFCSSDPELTATDEQVEQALATWVQDVPACIEDLPPYDRLVAASSWAQFQRFPAELAQAYRASGKTVVVEEFDLVSSVPGMGSGHCLDLPFQFGTYEAWQDAPMIRSFLPEQFEQLSQQTRAHLMDFVIGI